MEVLYASLIIFLAYFVRSICGFGASLISVPVLVFFLDLPDIVVLISILTIATSLVVVKKSLHDTDKPMVVSLLIGAVPASYLGIHLLNTLSPYFLLNILGVVLIIFAINFLLDQKLIQFKANKFNGLVAGVISGVLGGLFSTSGPPVVAYLSSVYKKTKVMRATLLSFFFVLNSFQMLGYLYKGNLNRENLTFSLYMLPAMFIASYAGHHVHLKVPEKQLKYGIALLMIVAGVTLILK